MAVNYNFEKYYRSVIFSIPLISLAFHFYVFKLDLIGYHVWRQTQTQTVINNFYQEDFNIFHPRVNDHADTDRASNMEFPIMQWVYALFFKAFGNHIIISRILSFVLGLFSVAGMYYLAKAVFKNKSIAALCAWAFNFSPLFYYYTLNPMPDNFALCFAIWSAGLFFTFISNNRIGCLPGSLICLCVATLAKLPFILFGTPMLAYLVIQTCLGIFTLKKASGYALLAAIIMAPAAAWYISVIPGWKGNGVVAGILDNLPNASVLLDIIRFNLISVLPELMINYGSVLFFLSGIYITWRSSRNARFYSCICWGFSLIAYFLFEMNMIAKVHDYYLLPFLPVLFLIVARGAYFLLSLKSKALTVLTLVALLLLPVTAYLRTLSRWNPKQPEFNKVYYDHKNELRNIVPQNALCVIGNDDSHCILLYYIDKKGWAFDHDQLTGPQLSYYIGKGARYLFTDSGVDERPDIKAFLQRRVWENGNVRVYALQSIDRSIIPIK